jgi:hypothetical protein
MQVSSPGFKAAAIDAGDWLAPQACGAYTFTVRNIDDGPFVHAD